MLINTLTETVRTQWKKPNVALRENKQRSQTKSNSGHKQFTANPVLKHSDVHFCSSDLWTCLGRASHYM